MENYETDNTSYGTVLHKILLLMTTTFNRLKIMIIGTNLHLRNYATPSCHGPMPCEMYQEINMNTLIYNVPRISDLM